MISKLERKAHYEQVRKWLDTSIKFIFSKNAKLRHRVTVVGLVIGTCILSLIEIILFFVVTSSLKQLRGVSGSFVNTKAYVFEYYTKQGFRDLVERRFLSHETNISFGNYSLFVGNLFITLLLPLGIIYILIGMIYGDNYFSELVGMILTAGACFLCLPSALVIDVVVIHMRLRKLFTKEKNNE